MADEELTKEVIAGTDTKPNKESLKRAYVTFLAGNGDYVKGVVGLAKGLRKVRSAYPLVVATLPDVPGEHLHILRSQGCIVREIEPIFPPPNQTQFAMAYYVINYSKLRIWNMEEYKKMIYLDADIQVYDNIDHLFDTEDGYLYAVMDCFCGATWSHSAQYKVGYCQQCPHKVAWPSHMGSPPPLYFNAGMFVFEPSSVTYHNLLHTLQLTLPTPFAEQDFLNMFFQEQYKPLPSEYNLVLMAMLWRHPENVDLKKVKVVHYCEPKPWRYTGKEANMDREDIKMLVAKWWNIYDDKSLDFKAQDLQVAAEQETLSRSSIMASISEPTISFVPAPPAA
ncbi:hypothetical protein QN277_004335 [Acacia crassicarpa]|uniref:Hexosyltransferase n=1 Tax=Acacia crassicarpa TaxID=499986 RepID=A0AAE1MBQ5_9FABA|nr:hypothetical protein QN277_004335 [Acacia crassicarpa]